MNFEFINVEQNTDEWYALRAGKLTSSNLSKVMANLGKAFGEPAKKYAVNIAIEQITGNPISSNYSNDHMERGHEQEPIARNLYEQELFCEVTNGGFFDGGFIGCSPDGLLEDGVIEIKSVIPSVHFANIKRGSVDPAYKWQCIGNLQYTGREWLDFISFCADFPEDKQLFTHRLYSEKLTEEFKILNDRTHEFESLVNDTKQLILKSNYIT
jgi:hypothetical protein